MENKKIVTVQDISCYGQCSITVALPVLSAYGIETAILPSAIMSNHTGGFSGFTCLDLTDEMPKIIRQWKQEKLNFDAIYTGYIGDVRQFSIIRQLKDLLKPGGKLIVDPAMADHGRMYRALGPEIAEKMSVLVREADVILPNLTEAAMLLGEPYKDSYTEEELKDFCSRLTGLGPEIALITGASFDQKQIGAVSYDGTTGSFTSYMGRKMPHSYHGTGDLFASVFIAEYLNGKSLYEAQKEACEFVIRCIEKTLEDGNHPYGVRFEAVLAERACGRKI